MDVAQIGNLPYCKGLWSVISGITCRCGKDLVEDELKNSASLLKSGLQFFKKFTDGSLQSILKTIPPRMYNLIEKLAPLLNLDAVITWDLVCNFMLYEYRNCAETFASQLTELTSIRALIEDIWNFYYSERITLIKCLKIMIEYKDNKNHPNNKEFLKFFQDLSMVDLLNSVREQIETLKFINPPSRSQLCTEDHLHRLYNSSLVEMRELLHILTIILHDIHIPHSEFNKIYNSIGGEPRRLTSTKSHEDKEALSKKIEEIRYSQASLLLVTLDVKEHAGMEDWIKHLRTTMQETLEHKCIRESYPQDSPLLLSWMLVNYAIEPDNVDVLNRYRPFGIRAIQLEVFHYLRNLMDNEMIREDTRYALIVRNSVYNLLSLLCEVIEEDRLFILNGIFDTVASTLRYPELAAKFWQDKEDGLWTLYKCAVEWYPYKFDPLTNIAIGLASASAASAKNISKELDNLPSISIELPRQREQKKLLKPYERECVIHKNTFTIGENCQYETLHVISNDKEVVSFRTRSSYWDALHHKIELLFLLSSGGVSNISEGNTDLPEHVSQGLKLLETLLATDMDIPPSMVIPTELSFEIINRFSYPILPSNIYKIVTACISLSSKLVLKYPQDILSRMKAGVYPRFNNCYQKPLDFAEGVSFDGGLIASWLSGIETINHTYPILTSYLDTLLNYLIAKESKEAMHTIEIPGMVFLLQAVLPKLDLWYFESDAERINVWLKSMYCLHRALDANLSKEDPRNDLQLIVAYSLLYLEPRHALLKLIRTGERTLHNKIITEINWVNGKGFKIIKSVQFALSVVNRLLMFRKSLGLELGDRSPLEVALYSSPCVPNGLLIVPTIVNYLYVWFSPSLQAMAVRLLKKFAESFSMSLLVCMGMDGTAIRETFASRLMSPTCAVEVKVAILELVAVCLERQPGLTEALFNIMHQAERNRIFPRSADEFLTEGCSHFLDLYLKRINQEDNIVYDKLYDSTMNLFRAMWYHRNEILVNYFRKRDKFWTHLFAPLLKDLVPTAKGYAQLLDVVTLELFKSPLLENDFSLNLKQLFDKGENHWKNLAKYIIEDESNMSVQSLYETNLESWYNFIVTLTDNRCAKHYPIDVIQIQFLTELSIDGLLTNIQSPDCVKLKKIILLFASLSLRCITSWKQHCVGDSKIFKSRLTLLTQLMAQSYQGYGKYLRQTLLSLLIGSIQLVKSTLTEDLASLGYLLGYACTMATSEVEELKKTAIVNNEGKKSSLSGTLSVSLVSQLLRCHVERTKESTRKTDCLQLRLFVPELMNCLSLTLQKYPYLRFTQASLSLLGIIAQSPYIPKFMDDNCIAKLWLALIPPVEIGNSMLDSLYKDITSIGDQWRCQDWWPIYTLGLEFVRSLVVSETASIYQNLITMFLSSHEEQLIVVSTLLRHTSDLVAADLVQSLVALVYAIVTQSFIWNNAIQETVRETLIKCLYLAYENTVNLLLRPRILKFIIDGMSVESAEELESCDDKLPSNELRLLVNKLILINSTCAISFVYLLPRLNTLIDTISTEQLWYIPMAEMNFGAPQMSISSGPRLTYGTIISSTQLFTQALYSRMKSCSDLKKILHTPTSELTTEANVPLLNSPRLLRRPYDPLICENSILSRATAFAPGRHIGKGNCAKLTKNTNGSPMKLNINKSNDPWFATMDETNTRLALELNLVLILCQALEGVTSTRPALRDRQLIARETATELGIFFDFIEHRGTPDNWLVKGSLIDTDPKRVRIVEYEKLDSIENILPARFDESEEDRVPEKKLSRDEILTSGKYLVDVNVQFLQLMGRLLKSVVESLDSNHLR